jgi:hypothetical protein
MNKRLVFKYPEGMKIKAKFEVIGQKIKMTLPNVIFCTDFKWIDTKTFCYDKRDMLWKTLFGSFKNVKRFVKQGKTRIIKIDTAPLIKSCDVLGVRKIK